LSEIDDTPSPNAGRSTPEPPGDLSAIVGWRLRRLRTQRGFSLERFAKLSGVSRGMLSQIELGKSMPTIGILWKIANALCVPFAALMSADTVAGTALLKRDKAKILASSEGRFTSRALFPFDGERRAEFYELRIAPRHEERAEAHAAGTTENLLVARGTLELFDGSQWYRLEEGDAILFDAGVPHAYRNPADEEAVVHLSMSYLEVIG
jgi:transcriptional regulator with XRE-family HTH domain